MKNFVHSIALLSSLAFGGLIAPAEAQEVEPMLQLDIANDQVVVERRNCFKPYFEMLPKVNAHCANYQDKEGCLNTEVGKLLDQVDKCMAR